MTPSPSLQSASGPPSRVCCLCVFTRFIVSIVLPTITIVINSLPRRYILHLFHQHGKFRTLTCHTRTVRPLRQCGSIARTTYLRPAFIKPPLLNFDDVQQPYPKNPGLLQLFMSVGINNSARTIGAFDTFCRVNERAISGREQVPSRKERIKKISSLLWPFNLQNGPSP